MRDERFFLAFQQGGSSATGVMPDMPTIIRPADSAAIDEAAQLLRAGEIVAVPTETVYGLAARADSVEAVAAIYRAKGRPDFNPLIVHVADVAEAERLAVLDERARALAARFWPGPLTLVLPRAATVSDAVTGGQDTVALRVPAHPLARALLAAAGVRPLGRLCSREGG